MQKTQLRFADSDAEISVESLRKWMRLWLIDCEGALLSHTTIANRRLLTDKLLWFLRDREYATCDVSALKEFMAYIAGGHADERGRWGNNRLRTQVRPRTILTHYDNLRTMFRYFVSEGHVHGSPMEYIKRPIARRDQIMPFTQDQVESLLRAARKSKCRRRDEAIILFLLDTGSRNTELCNLRLRDVDMDSRSLTVLGKGNKRRTLCFSRDTFKALWQYLQENPCGANECVFRSVRGTTAGEGLTKDGLGELIRRLGKVAGVVSTRCSPHTFRHTFAVEFLRDGGNVFTLKELLGHTTLAMVNRYVALAEADIENQHRLHSPVERLRRRSA